MGSLNRASTCPDDFAFPSGYLVKWDEQGIGWKKAINDDQTKTRSPSLTLPITQNWSTIDPCMASESLFRSIFEQDDSAALQALAARSGVPEALTLRDFLAGTYDAGSEVPPSDLLPGSLVAISLSRPFLLMFLYGAERCCRYTVAALDASDFGDLRQPSGNLLHALIAGSRAGFKASERYEAVLAMLLSCLTREQVHELCYFPGHLGLRPVELAIHWDQFRLAERLLCNGALSLTEAKVRGVHGIVTLDIDDYDTRQPDSRAAVSPLMLLGNST